MLSPPSSRDPSERFFPFVSNPPVSTSASPTRPPRQRPSAGGSASTHRFPLCRGHAEPRPHHLLLNFSPRVSGTADFLTVSHRSGQTFLAWTEKADLRGERYRIYRSTTPISANNLSHAVMLAEVGKNSARFYTNLYNPRGTDTWQPRHVDRLVIQDGAAPLPAGTGLLVWTLAPQDFGGAQSGSAYYAVTVTPAGEPEIFQPGYVIGPVSEAVADPFPVEITPLSAKDIENGRHVFIQYMDLRSWNPTFHAPNPTNHYYGFDPTDPDVSGALQYAYDYEVFTPTTEMCGGTLPERLPVIVRLHGWRGNTLSADEGYPDRYCAYGIYPVDVTDTWYFGFAKYTDFRQGIQVGENDVIANYTEQRILRMVYDLLRRPPGPPADPQRVYVSGQSMGGTGALAFAERYPNVFAAAYASQPMTNFLTAGVTTMDWIVDAALKWGRPEYRLPVEIAAPGEWAAPLQKYNGTSVWDWENSVETLSATRLPGRQADEMAPLGVIHGFDDDVLAFDTQAAPFYPALEASRRPWAGMVTHNGHEWMYYLGLPPSLAPIGDTQYTARPFWDFQVVRDETVPGFSSGSYNAEYQSDAPGRTNQNVKWSSSWDPWDGKPVDEAERWQMSFCSTKTGYRTCGDGLPVTQTVDVTPRRLQHFRVTPGARYDWENRQVKDGALIASGTVTADSYGLVTIPKFTISAGGNRLILKPHPSRP